MFAKIIILQIDVDVFVVQESNRLVTGEFLATISRVWEGEVMLVCRLEG